MKNVYSKLFEVKKILGVVVKGADNSYLKTKYADLNSVIDATEDELNEAGLFGLIL